MSNWSGRLPTNALTLLCGPSCVGKNLVTLDLAARLTTQRPLPLETVGDSFPWGVLLLNKWDTPAEVCWRIHRMGAQLDLVHMNTHEHSFEDMLKTLCTTSLVPDMNIGLIVIDPIDELVITEATHSNLDVRKALEPLMALMGVYAGLQVIGVHCTSKNPRGLKSTATALAARSVLYIEDINAHQGTHVLKHIKSSTSCLQPDLAFKIANVNGDEDTIQVIW